MFMDSKCTAVFQLWWGRATAMNVQRGSKERGIKALQWNKTQMIDACTDTRPVLEIGFHKEEVKGKRLFSWTSHCGFIKRKYTRVIAIFTTVSRFEISVAVWPQFKQTHAVMHVQYIHTHVYNHPSTTPFIFQSPFKHYTDQYEPDQ